MIVEDCARFAEIFARLPPNRERIPRGVFMVDPVDFAVDAESAIDNRYMQLTAPVDAERARRQSRRLARAISKRDIPVVQFPGRAETPDAVYPNNVFATIPGRAIVGSMRHSGRRREAGRQDIRRFFTDVLRYELIDLSGHDCVAELTGPLVLDRARGVGLCGMTDRVDDNGARLMDEAFDLAMTLCFPLRPGEYHTNVVMAVLVGRALVIHADAVADAAVADALLAAYPDHLELDAAECDGFAGNCIALSDTDLFMSERAADALRPASRAVLQRWGFRIHAAPVDELEKAGGSVRCMIGEVY